MVSSRNSPVFSISLLISQCKTLKFEAYVWFLNKRLEWLSDHIQSPLFPCLRRLYGTCIFRNNCNPLGYGDRSFERNSPHLVENWCPKRRKQYPEVQLHFENKNNLVAKWLVKKSKLNFMFVDLSISLFKAWPTNFQIRFHAQNTLHHSQPQFLFRPAFLKQNSRCWLRPTYASIQIPLTLGLLPGPPLR